jgi:hypothetical protein
MTKKTSDSTAAVNTQIWTLKAQLAQAEICNMGRDICSTFRNETEVYFHEDNLSGKSDGWRQIDTMDFHRRILLERMISHFEYWLPRQTERENKAKYFADKYRSEYVKDNEMSENNFKGAVARYKSEYILTFNMQSELAKLQQAYKEDQGRSFTTIKPTQIDGDLPEDIATLMLEMKAIDEANNPEKEEVSKAS